MEHARLLNRQLDTLGWGLFFVWWGITELFKFLPQGIGAIGLGLILLGLNAVRARNRVPASGFTTTLGILALVLGGLEMAAAVLNLPLNPDLCDLVDRAGHDFTGTRDASNQRE